MQICNEDFLKVCFHYFFNLLYHQQECSCHVVCAERGQGEGLGRVVLQEVAVVQVAVDKHVDETALVEAEKNIRIEWKILFFSFYMWENASLRSC